jgi:hypothetical protein
MSENQVTLITPLTYGSGQLVSLTFRRPKAGDLRGLQLGGLAQCDVDLILKLAQRLSIQAVTDAQLAEMDPPDLLQVTEKIVDFFAGDPSQATVDLAFRRPKAGDLRGLQLGGLSQCDVGLVLTLARRLSIQGVTDAQLWELDPPDLLHVAEKIVGFFEAAPSRTTPSAPGVS